MKNVDIVKQEQTELLASMQQAMTDGQNDKAAEMFMEWATGLQQGFIAEASQLMQSEDQKVLAARGVRTLTSEERQYYAAFADAAKSKDPKQALANLDKVLPETVINSVFDDLTKDHEILSVVDFVNTTALTEFIVNKGTKQLATWAKLCDDIVKELTGDLAVVPVTFAKLSAFIPVCKAMLELGPEWLDRYVRAILAEAIAYGLEEGIVNGTGVDQPIGMTRNLAGPVDPSTGYPAKTAVAITEFTAAQLGARIGALALDEQGNSRKVGEVILIVNPADYYTKVYPATVQLTTAGYVSMLPYKLTIIESEQVAANSAILGIKGRYFMGVGTAKSGKIEYSDHYRFLEDERVYLTKLYGNGMPKDNTSFQLLDITNLVPVVPTVLTQAATP